MARSVSGWVRRMLLSRGWEETKPFFLVKGAVTWAAWDRQSGIDWRAPDGSTLSMDFPEGATAPLIVAVCEAVAKETTERRPPMGERGPCTCPAYEPWDPDWDGVVPVDPACPWHGRRAETPVGP